MKLKKIILTGVLSVAMFVGSVIPSMAAELTQSSRWVGSENTWRVSDNNGGYLKNCWFQDDITKDWYLLGAGDDNTIMFSGLITDQSTGKTYLLNTNHDGTYGRMLTADGTYTINGQNVYLTFNQEHNGTFGCILTGLTADEKEFDFDGDGVLNQYEKESYEAMKNFDYDEWIKEHPAGGNKMYDWNI